MGQNIDLIAFLLSIPWAILVGISIGALFGILAKEIGWGEQPKGRLDWYALLGLIAGIIISIRIASICHSNTYEVAGYELNVFATGVVIGGVLGGFFGALIGEMVNPSGINRETA